MNRDVSRGFREKAGATLKAFEERVDEFEAEVERMLRVIDTKKFKDGLLDYFGWHESGWKVSARILEGYRRELNARKELMEELKKIFREGVEEIARNLEERETKIGKNALPNAKAYVRGYRRLRGLPMWAGFLDRLEEEFFKNRDKEDPFDVADYLSICLFYTFTEEEGRGKGFVERRLEEGKVDILLSLSKSDIKGFLECIEVKEKMGAAALQRAETDRISGLEHEQELREILAKVDEKRKATRKELEELLGAPRTTIRRRLDLLVDLGLLKQEKEHQKYVYRRA